MSDFDETCQKKKKQLERGIKRVESWVIPCVGVRQLEGIVGTMFRRLKYI